MNTEVQGQQQAVMVQNAAPWERVRSPKSRFVSSHVKDSRIYAALRSFAAVVSIAIVWSLITTRLHPASVADFLDATITFRHLTLALLVVLLWNLCFAWVPRLSHSPWSELGQELRLILMASVVSSSVILLPAAVGRHHVFHLYVFVLLLLALQATAVALLAATWLVGGHITPRVTAPRRCLIVGSGRRASALRSILVEDPGVYEIVGCLDDEYIGNDAERDRYLGRLSALEGLLRTHPIDMIVIGLPIKSCYDQIQQVIRTAESVGVEANYLADVFNTSVARRHVRGHQRPHFTVLRVTHHDDRRHIKRMCDVAGAAVLLLALSPLLLFAAIGILCTSRGPLFFVQERFGKDRQRFRMYKFRTMVPNAEKLQAALENQNEVQGPVFKIRRDPRITPFGAMLRRTSIDELPQLINVLRGEMSLVGPRPLPVRDVARFDESWLLRRFSVKPGLTCLWQVNGRSNTNFDYWIQQDLTYIDNWSLGLDMKILFRTVGVVLRGSGAM